MIGIARLLSEIRPEVDFSASQDFIDDGILDSFDVVTLVAAIDKEFGISIDGVDIVPEHFRTINAITNLVRKYGVTQ
jgi:acyl carrier protein